MKFFLSMTVAAAALMCLMQASAQEQRGGPWPKREPFKPDPGKVVVPPGYKVGVFAAGLDTPSSATVDKDGNLWVAISGVLLGSPEADKIDPAHVKIFDKQGKLLREVGKGTFKTVMNEIGYCAENDTMYIPEYGEKIWEMKGGVNGELKLIIKDLFIGDHRNGGLRQRHERAIHLLVTYVIVAPCCGVFELTVVVHRIPPGAIPLRI